jgi:hypothetical protein
MRFFLSIWFAVTLFTLAFAAQTSLAADPSPAPKAEQPAAPEAAPDTSEQRSGRLWVCCDDGRERWTATHEVCQKRGGQLLPSRFCEKPKYVCCKQGRADWWMPDAHSCHRDGGVVADDSYCR